MHELRTPLDSLFDLRGTAEIEFSTWTGSGAIRLVQDAVGRLSTDVWFPPGTALDKFMASQNIRSIDARLDDGRQVKFSPSLPLVSQWRIDAHQLRLTLRPSRADIGPYPKGRFHLRSYLTNLPVDSRGVNATVPGLGEVRHRPAPNVQQLRSTWLPGATPTVLAHSEVSVPSRLSFKRAEHLLTGHLLRLSLGSGTSIEPVAHEVTGDFGQWLRLGNTVARSPSNLPLLPERNEDRPWWFEFSEVTAGIYERQRQKFSLDQTVRALSDVLRKDPPHLETRSLLIATLLESLTKAYASDRRHQWKSYRGGLNLMLQGILAPQTTKRIKDTRTAMVHSVTAGAGTRDYFVMLGALRLGLLRVLGYRGPVSHPWLWESVEFPPKRPL